MQAAGDPREPILIATAASGLEKRRIGTTSLEVTTLGLGCASLAGNMSPVPEADARSVIPHALDHGITLVDTAPFYGFGKSERLVGDAVRPRRDEVVLSTKAGRILVPQFGPYTREHDWKDPLPFVDAYDYSYAGIMRSFEDSLQRLGLNRIDILLVHDIGTFVHGDANAGHWKALAEGGYRAMRELRDKGTISAIGLGVNEWEVLMDAFEIGDWDVFLLAGRYTLLEQTSLSPFLETCLQRQASVICGGPFNSGILVGGSTWNYTTAPGEIVDKAKAIEAVCADFGVVLPAAALHFPLRHPAIATVLPGPRSPAEFDQIWQWWNAEIPTELWAALKDKSLIDPRAPI